MIKVLKTLLLALMVSVTMTSCSDDDGPTTQSGAKAVSGTYSGTMSMSVMGTALDPVDCDVVINAGADDTTVDIVLPTVTYGGHQSIPSITVSGVAVTTSDNKTYTLQQASFEQDIYSGTIQGTVTDGRLALTYVMNAGKMPMPINFTFDGAL
jgi:hypothetical protein